VRPEVVVTDAELVEQSRTGRPDAFVELVDRHARAVHAYLARRAGRATADELLAEVWARAWEAKGTYDVTYPGARPWLYGIARNVLRRHWRAMTHAGRIVATTDLFDPWVEADDRLEAARRLGAVIDAVRALSADERDVLLLVAWEQLSPADAALVLGIPPGTARSRLHRARHAVRARLDPLTVDPPTTEGPTVDRPTVDRPTVDRRPSETESE
jgi:RNA polymerase sigma factor (sigma-70 family)